jgi:hypothetical protein
MENKDYKVEMKPTFWVVSLSSGAYSDWIERHLYFRANSEDEVWNYLCRYLDDLYIMREYDWLMCYDKIAIRLEDGTKSYVMKKWLEQKGNDIKKVNWDADYGNCEIVKIERLNVIEFLK